MHAVVWSCTVYSQAFELCSHLGISENQGYLSFGGVLIIEILLFRVLYWGPLFSETPI